MHVDIVPNRNSRPCALIRESFRENGKVRHRTLLNISDLPTSRILAVKRALQGDFDEVGLSGAEKARTEQGPQFGGMYVAYQIAKEIGLADVLGNNRKGKLALFMVIGQVLCGVSRRALIQWARSQAVYEVLGIGTQEEIDFNENDLYDVLDDLADRRFEIELKLFRKRRKACSRLFLYDVTSSYLEGVCNELGAWGFNRDGKKGKRQIVIGLLTNDSGDPVAVDVFPGNTSDPKTVVDQIDRLSKRFGVHDVVFVGDRGMVKRIPLESIEQADYHYITAITKPQVESLIREGVLQLGLFNEELGEIENQGVRYVFRRNPVRAAQIADSRRQRLEKVRKLATKLSDGLRLSNRKRTEVALRNVNRAMEKFEINNFATAILDDRTVFVEVDEQALEQKSRLDGVYVLKTDVRSDDLDKEMVHKVYKSLYRVECDFRNMKTDLEVRPVFVRKASRTRGHVLVVMLALILRRELEKRLKPVQIEVGHALRDMTGWTILREFLGPIRFSRLPVPNARQQMILGALGIQQPTSLAVPSKNIRQKKD
jgi:transposase